MTELLEVVGRAQIVMAFAGLLILLLWESAHPFFAFFQTARKERGLHIARNLLLGALNTVVIAVLFVGLWIGAAAWAEAKGVGLLNLLDLPPWLHAVGAVLLFDAWTYTWHWMNHRVPLFWRFHQVHHSDMKMDVTTASRFHTGEIILSSLFRIPVILLLGTYVWELLLYETLMFAVVQFHHANIALPPRLDRALRTVIVTPAMHKVHHSRWRAETDSNYSSLFSIWDRIARTFRIRERLEEIEFGVDDVSKTDEHFSDVLAMPFVSRRAREESAPAGSRPS